MHAIHSDEQIHYMQSDNG